MTSPPGEYRLYRDLAGWWPLISPPAEYAAEAACLATVFGEAAIGVRDVLDLGSGGGHVAVHLKDRFSLTLVDLSEDMLAVSRRLNPGCAHLQGDMRTLRLGRELDAVLVHDAIDYITSRDELRQVIATAFAHCRPGGIAVFVPDHLADTFRAGSGGGGGTDAAGRQGSFREWTWDPDPADDWVQAEYEFTLREADGVTEVVRETHRLGAFRRRTWLRLLAAGGFEPEARIGADAAAGGGPAGREPAGGDAAGGDPGGGDPGGGDPGGGDPGGGEAGGGDPGSGDAAGGEKGGHWPRHLFIGRRPAGMAGAGRPSGRSRAASR